MLAKLKLALYGLLLILGLWFAWGFYVNYSAVAISASVADPENAIGAPAQTKDAAATQPADAQPTNVDAVPPVQTNELAVGEIDTNQPDAIPADANLDAADSTNTVAATNVPPAKIAKKAKKISHKHVNAHEAVKVATADTRKSMISYLVGLIFVAVGLGGLIAYDFTRTFAHNAVDMMFDDDGPATKDPEYERAEQVWAEGRPMEAVELMRDYLKKNPREQYVALRIAEIYEKDFRNYLAAAMEYEEVLKKKLHPDRWGWAAIHLCNLYSKLGRQKDYDALLHRIVDDFPTTSAAKKARKVLGLPEDESAPETPGQPSPVQFLEAEPTAEPSEPPSNSHLPPGFRPKK